jgi:hypothetical protein
MNTCFFGCPTSENKQMKDVNVLFGEFGLVDVDFESNFSNLGFFNTMLTWLNPRLAIQS